MPTVRGGSGGAGSSLSNGFVIRFTDPGPLPKCLPLRPLTIPLTVTPAGANSIAIVNNNNTQVTHIGGGVYEVEKIGGTDGARDAAAVSTAGATGDFVLRIKPVGAPGAASGSFQYGAGVNSDPLTNDSFDTIDHLWFRVIPGLLWSIFEGGADVGDFGDSAYAWIWRIGSSLSYGRGADLAAAQASPDRTVSDSSTMYFDSVTFGLGDKMEVMFYNVVSVASLTADVGIFSYSGQAVLLEQGYALAAGLGTFTYTGQAAALTRALGMPAAFATFSYTGQAANLVRALPMAASLGTFSYTGQAAALTVAPRMAAGLGTFSYSGQAANLSRSYTLAAGLGAFTYSGQAAALSRGLPMAAAPGVFSYTGQVATLAVVAPVSYSLAAGLGVFSYTGQPATLTVAIAAPSPWTVEGDPPPVMWTVEGDPELADNVEEPYSATYFDPIYYQAEGNSWVAETGDGTTPVEVEADPLLTDDTEGGFNSLFYDPAFYDTSVLTWMLEDEPQRVAILEET